MVYDFLEPKRFLLNELKLTWNKIWILSQIIDWLIYDDQYKIFEVTKNESKNRKEIGECLNV